MADTTDPVAVPTAHSSAPTDCRVPDPSDAAADGTFGGRHDHRAGYATDKLARALGRAQRGYDLRGSEAHVLGAEIDRLRAQVKDLTETNIILGEELADARRRADLR